MLAAFAPVKESTKIALPEVFVDSEPGLLYSPPCAEAEKVGRVAAVSK